MNNPCQVPLFAYQGADFYLPIVWNYTYNGSCLPVNLSGYSFEMQVRDTITATGAPMVNVSTANGNIIVNSLEGQIEIYIPNIITSTLPLGGFFYDVVATNNVGLIGRLFGGQFVVKGLVTR